MIVSDSDWAGKTIGRCLNQSDRLIVFAPGTQQEEIDAKIKEVKAEMRGQSQYVKQLEDNGKFVVVFRDIVDSGD